MLLISKHLHKEGNAHNLRIAIINLWLKEDVSENV